MAEELTTDLSIVFKDLMKHYTLLNGALDNIYNHSQQIRILSFNSSVEAARAGQAGRGFRIISSEIKKISEVSDEANVKCGEVVNHIEDKMHELIGVRTSDIAFDVMDKIERNLFERNCDVHHLLTST